MSLMLSTAEYVSLKAPFGLDQIRATFGDIFAYLRADHSLDPRWQADQMVTISLPFPLVLSWDRTRHVTHMTCHRLMGPIFGRCFQQIAESGLQQEITSFGGCYAFRPQRTGTKLSTHSWGIAVDLNPENNAQGTAGHLHPEIVSIFRNIGLAWGGDWPGAACDPMHFQFCTGY